MNTRQAMKRQLETAQDRLEELERLLKVNQREISHKIEILLYFVLCTMYNILYCIKLCLLCPPNEQGCILKDMINANQYFSHFSKIWVGFVILYVPMPKPYMCVECERFNTQLAFLKGKIRFCCLILCAIQTIRHCLWRHLGILDNMRVLLARLFVDLAAKHYFTVNWSIEKAFCVVLSNMLCCVHSFFSLII